MLRLVLISLLLVLCSCASKPSVMDFSTAQVPESDDDSIDLSLMMAQQRAFDRLAADDSNPGESLSLEENQEPEAATNEPPVGAKEVQHDYVLDTKNHLPKVQKWIKYYSQKDRERFQRFLNRGARYKSVIQDLLVTNGLPPDLYYLGILESGYVTKAVSHAGAVGPWQFMAPTGRQYGLKINNYVDERTDPVRSTLAAIRYLKELYRLKKSWYMALAAYNAGPGRVKRAMRRGGTRSYWKLTNRRLLPYDTREYIPQFLAILTIGKNLAKYDFEETVQEHMVPMELVKVPSPVKLSKIAKVTGYSLKDLKSLNAHLRKGMTPPTKKRVYPIWVKKDGLAKFETAFNSLKKHRIKGLKARRYIASRRTRIHRVRRGQTLSQIARRYRTSVSKIKRLNGLKRSHIYVGQKLRVKGRAPKRRVASYHRVRRGENLTVIARKYGVSLGRLKKMNGLRGGKIFVGQKLKLRGSVAKSKKRTRRYKIRSGDNLYKIAKKFGLSVRKLKRLNKLRSSKIMRGQYLIVASK